MKKLLISGYGKVLGLTFSVLLAGTTASIAADQYGTSDEAKAMLENAVTAIKADKPTALKSFTDGTDGFKDRDLYVFCAEPATSEAVLVAHGANPALIGKRTDSFVDKAGKEFGKEILAVAEEGKFHAVEYMWPREVDADPVEKASFITTVSDLICGVGYYKAS